MDDDQQRDRDALDAYLTRGDFDGSCPGCGAGVRHEGQPCGECMPLAHDGGALAQQPAR